jgi:hypothetical protein
MRSGGSFDIDAHNDDLTQIADGNYASISILKLPLQTKISQGGNSYFGGGLHTLTPTQLNPIVGQVQPARFSLKQPANSIALVTQALDENGDFVVSYPFNSSYENTGEEDNQLGNFLYADQGGISNGNLYAFGFMRLNGVGAWLQMSLLPLTASLAPATFSGSSGINNIIQMGWAGHSSVAGPISFIDWIGYCDADGDTSGPDGGYGSNQYILAAVTCNISLSGRSGSIGDVRGGAIPNSSGRSARNVDAQVKQKQRDVLVPRRRR